MTLIDTSKILKAQSIFERFRQDMQDDRDQAGAIQAFEFSRELNQFVQKMSDFL